MNAPCIIAAAWTFWCFLHSFLICRSLTGFLSRHLGRHYVYYRFFYNLFSLSSAAGVLYLHLLLPRQQLWSWHGGWRLLQGGLLLYALFMFATGLRCYDLGYFAGIKQIRDYRRGESSAGMAFTRKEILRFVRHPWYSGGLSFLVAFGGISDVSLAAKLVLIAYLLIGAALEEKKLLAELGEEYAVYRQEVPMLFPWRILGGKIRAKAPGRGGMERR